MPIGCSCGLFGGSFSKFPWKYRGNVQVTSMRGPLQPLQNPLNFQWLTSGFSTPETLLSSSAFPSLLARNEPVREATPVHAPVRAQRCMPRAQARAKRRAECTALTQKPLKIRARCKSLDAAYPAQKKFPIVNSNTFDSSYGKGRNGKPHSNLSGPKGENQRIPKP